MKMRGIKRLIKTALVAAGCVLVFLSCAGAEEKGFSDVKGSDWYYDTVMEMSDKGVLSGYSDGSFRPDANITAAEYISVLCRLKGLSPTQAQSGHWAAPLLQTALDKGWYDYDENPPTGEKFDLPIERQLAVKILIKAFAGDGLSYDYNTESAKIKDFDMLSGRYYDTVLFAYKDGLVEGDSDGRFRPAGYLTRAEACTLIKKACDKYNSDTVGAETAPVTSVTPYEEPAQTHAPISGGISRNGALKVIGASLCGEDGTPVVLKGISTHGLQWFPNFTSKEYIKAAADRGANVIRFAMYTEEGGYIQSPSVKNTLVSGVDNALACDMYAIIDWHILSDGNPMTHINEAKDFFAEMAEKYKDAKGVIYEICNEPNGSVSWSKDIKPYAEEIISVIRSYDGDAVILVGSPTWSQDIDKAAADRIAAENIMYTCHFYAGTHTDWLRDRIKTAVGSGLPVFISEWGVSDASGSGGVFEEETKKWLDFMNENGLSRCSWSYCDKNESSALLMSGSDPSDGLSDSELSAAGKIVFDDMQ